MSVREDLPGTAIEPTDLVRRLFDAEARRDVTYYRALLADEFTVVTFDRPGISRSPRPAATIAISLAQQADDAAGLLRVLHLAPAVVVGHGGGGSIACELAAHHPGLVRLAVVCGGHPSYVPDVDRLRAGGVPMAVVVSERDDGSGAGVALLIASTGATRWPAPDGPVGSLPRPDAFVALLRQIIHTGGIS